MSSGYGGEDRLLRLIEDGVSASATALGEVSKTNWVTQTVSINADGVDNMRSRMAADQAMYYGSYLAMPGAVFMFIVPQKRGPTLSRAFLGERGKRPGAIVPLESECIAEISNIVVHAIVNSLANACDEPFIISAPHMMLDRKSALLAGAVDKLKNNGESYAVMAYVHLSSEKLSSDCTVLLFLSPSFHTHLLESLS